MDWKNPADLASWKATRKKTLEAIWAERFYPLQYGIPLAAERPRAIQTQITPTVEQNWTKDGESAYSRLHRVDPGGEELKTGKHYLSKLLAYDKGRDLVVLSPIAKRASKDKKRKAALLAIDGLASKANRELACGLLGGEVVCTNGHRFSVNYECGNRYCRTCGPKGARKLFAQKSESLGQVAQRLMDCGDVNCKACYWIKKEPAKHRGEFAHWPPLPGTKRPPMVIAKLDFTVVNTGQAAPELIRRLNLCIKKFCRAIERLGYVQDRQSYGLATCDELGAGNTNIHAHGVYVGPWLPQDKGKMQLSRLWAEVTGYTGPLPRSMSGGKACRGTVRRRGLDSRTEPFRGGFIVSIKPAKDFAEALYHAIKYPAKFAELAGPDRLAELESIFHRVRRFHCYGAFYNPDVEKPEVPGRSCPSCGGTLHDRGAWITLDQLRRRGLKDMEVFQLELNRYKAMKPQEHPPP